MKTTVAVMSVVLWWCGLGIGSGQQPVRVSEAEQHVGQEVVVEGTVERVELQPDGNVRIHFEGVDPAHGLSILVIKGTGLDADPRLSFVPGHRLAVKGRVELDQGRPEIKVTSRDQITAHAPRE
ncbi:MAG: hypothetical protein JO069_03400 [Verrucomicrobia bacterium]|nr:hypothetical protein [Verrucomicrobiota bacterium]